MRSWELQEGDEIAPGRRAVRLLGGGRRHEAYLAWDDELRALVVAKLLRPDRVGSPEDARALRSEARMLDSLAHPMLLRSFGSVVDGEHPHLVLEHVEGPRLSTLIRRHGVILEQFLPLALSVASALHYLAGREVVHLDVKPSNIVMGATPCLIDLSVARRLDQLGELTSPVGTAGYMAPEQRDPDLFLDIGPGSDVWGLGATMLEALPARVSPALRELIRDCLAARPADRPSAGEVADVIEGLVDLLPPPRIGRFRPAAPVR